MLKYQFRSVVSFVVGSWIWVLNRRFDWFVVFDDFGFNWLWLFLIGVFFERSTFKLVNLFLACQFNFFIVLAGCMCVEHIICEGFFQSCIISALSCLLN
jgi:hypothetical protein